jgi:hypothetical protein
MGLFSNKAGDAAKKESKRVGAAYQDAGDRMQDAIFTGGQWVSSDQQAGHNYLQEQNEIDRMGSQNAKRRMMGLYGIDGGTGSQQGLIDQAQQSPLYAAMQGTRQAGEDSIMRNAAATGGLRSGNVQSNMYDFNQRLDERSLLESYDQQLQGLEGISQWETNENNIYDAGLLPSQTRANALVGSQEAKATGDVQRAEALAQGRLAKAGSEGGLGSSILGTAGTVVGGYFGGPAGAAIGGSVGGAVGSKFSDPVLKDNVVFLGEDSGHNIYEWTWNRLAESLGLSGYDTGVMASEIEQTHPGAVGMAQGYQTVNYDMLGV